MDDSTRNGDDAVVVSTPFFRPFSGVRTQQTATVRQVITVYAVIECAMVMVTPQLDPHLHPIDLSLRSDALFLLDGRDGRILRMIVYPIIAAAVWLRRPDGLRLRLVVRGEHDLFLLSHAAAEPTKKTTATFDSDKALITVPAHLRIAMLANGDFCTFEERESVSPQQDDPLASPHGLLALRPPADYPSMMARAKLRWKGGSVPLPTPEKLTLRAWDSMGSFSVPSFPIADIAERARWVVDENTHVVMCGVAILLQPIAEFDSNNRPHLLKRTARARGEHFTALMAGGSHGDHAAAPGARDTSTAGVDMIFTTTHIILVFSVLQAVRLHLGTLRAVIVHVAADTSSKRIQFLFSTDEGILNVDLGLGLNYNSAADASTESSPPSRTHGAKIIGKVVTLLCNAIGVDVKLDQRREDDPANVDSSMQEDSLANVRSDGSGFQSEHPLSGVSRTTSSYGIFNKQSKSLMRREEDLSRPSLRSLRDIPDLLRVPGPLFKHPCTVLVREAQRVTSKRAEVPRFVVLIGDPQNDSSSDAGDTDDTTHDEAEDPDGLPPHRSIRRRQVTHVLVCDVRGKVRKDIAVERICRVCCFPHNDRLIINVEGERPVILEPRSQAGGRTPSRRLCDVAAVLSGSKRPRPYVTVLDNRDEEILDPAAVTSKEEASRWRQEQADRIRSVSLGQKPSVILQAAASAASRRALIKNASADATAIFADVTHATVEDTDGHLEEGSIEVSPTLEHSGCDTISTTRLRWDPSLFSRSKSKADTENIAAAGGAFSSLAHSLAVSSLVNAEEGARHALTSSETAIFRHICVHEMAYCRLAFEASVKRIALSLWKEEHLSRSFIELHCSEEAQRQRIHLRSQREQGALLRVGGALHVFVREATARRLIELDQELYAFRLQHEARVVLEALSVEEALWRTVWTESRLRLRHEFDEERASFELFALFAHLCYGDGYLSTAFQVATRQLWERSSLLTSANASKEKLMGSWDPEMRFLRSVVDSVELLIHEWRLGITDAYCQLQQAGHGELEYRARSALNMCEEHERARIALLEEACLRMRQNFSELLVAVRDVQWAAQRYARLISALRQVVAEESNRRRFTEHCFAAVVDLCRLEGNDRLLITGMQLAEHDELCLQSLMQRPVRVTYISVVQKRRQQPLVSDDALQCSPASGAVSDAVSADESEWALTQSPGASLARSLHEPPLVRLDEPPPLESFNIYQRAYESMGLFRLRIRTPHSTLITYCNMCFARRLKSIADETLSVPYDPLHEIICVCISEALWGAIVVSLSALRGVLLGASFVGVDDADVTTVMERASFQPIVARHVSAKKSDEATFFCFDFPQVVAEWSVAEDLGKGSDAADTSG